MQYFKGNLLYKQALSLRFLFFLYTDKRIFFVLDRQIDSFPILLLWSFYVYVLYKPNRLKLVFISKKPQVGTLKRHIMTT